MYRKISLTIGFSLLIMSFSANSAFADESISPSYLKAIINSEESIEVEKNSIFDASQSFIPEQNKKIKYNWDFGDGNRNEGLQVTHTYKSPGEYTVTLTIDNGINESISNLKIFAYRKLIVLITDQTEKEERISLIQEFAKKKGVFIKTFESFGSSTEFISEEVLTKKMTEKSIYLQKAEQIIIWTKENTGLNALSRYIQNNQKKDSINFSQKSIIVLLDSISGNIDRIQRQFQSIKPRDMVITKEAVIYPVIENTDYEDFINTLEKGGYEYKMIDEKSGKIMPWNFMSHFVNILINNGIPDNTIALILLLPLIATVVAFMKQVVGINTFGIYTPSIITLSFLIIGIYAGLLTLVVAVLIGALSRPVLKKVHMLFFPKMAIVITIISLALFLTIISGIYLSLFNAEFLSIAIFPMLILSTLVENFISVKTEKGLYSATVLMASTILTASIAYFIVGGEINLGLMDFKFEFIKNTIMTYPESIFLLIVINIFLGKWSGLRLFERIRFREIFRHIEE